MANEKSDVLHGSLALMVLRTLDTLGPQHGWGIARRIEQISGDALALNQGTLYPALLRLEQMGWITSKWGTSDNNRRAKFYSITRAGKKQLAAEAKNWERISEILGRFVKPVQENPYDGLRVFFGRLSGLFRTGRLERDMEEELDFHLQNEVAENLRKGMSPTRRWQRPGGALAASPR